MLATTSAMRSAGFVVAVFDAPVVASSLLKICASCLALWRLPRALPPVGAGVGVAVGVGVTVGAGVGVAVGAGVGVGVGTTDAPAIAASSAAKSQPTSLPSVAART